MESPHDFRILIVEDEVIIVEDIKDTLTDLGYSVCATCYDSETAIDEIYRHKPDLVLLDINIRGQRDGIQVGQVIHDHHHVPFIYLTSHSDRDTLARAKQTRPRGYIVKPFKEADLISSIEIALHNHSEDLKRAQLTHEIVNKACHQPLSDREYEIFMDLIDGLNNRQIGERRFISVNTVKAHIKKIFDKMDVHDRVSAVRKVVAM